MIMRMLIAVTAMSLLARPVMAHAFLDHADPGAGATLAQAPKQIALAFTKEIEPVSSGISVSDADGHDVEAAAPVVSGNIMTVALKPLTQGRYRVSWHVVSIDTHQTEGSYNFSIAPPE